MNLVFSKDLYNKTMKFKSSLVLTLSTSIKKRNKLTISLSSASPTKTSSKDILKIERWLVFMKIKRIKLTMVNLRFSIVRFSRQIKMIKTRAFFAIKLRVCSRQKLKRLNSIAAKNAWQRQKI